MTIFAATERDNMNRAPRNLPVGIQDFKKLRQGGYVYVDKTQFVYELARLDRPYFLGRPRRFGKSLFLSTLKAYFEGEKDLFDGLAIAELEKDWKKYPVIYIDLNREGYNNPTSLEAALDFNLRQYEEKWGRNDDDISTCATRFAGLIKRMCEKAKERVVVLIDEYDKPLISTLDDISLNDEMRKTLKGFYGVMKAEDANLRFAMLTGVTKFSKVSVFSDLNQLIDISLDKNYSEICGISETELQQYFQPEIQALADDNNMTCDAAFAEMKKRYDGYHFAKVSEDMYNPFSVLNTFEKRSFSDYWYKTGTPSMLVRQLRQEKVDTRKLEGEITATESMIEDYRPGETTVIPLLYQSGYLTIKKYDRQNDRYYLGFPNEEVRYGFWKSLLPEYAPANLWLMNTFFAGDFTESLQNGDVEGFMTQIKAFFASIEYDRIPKAQKNENYFQLIFYLMFKLMGQFVRVEEKSAEGRADAVVWTEKAIYVFEFKMTDTAEAALKQIDDKGYLIPYSADHRPTVKIGVEFSMDTGTIQDWKDKK